MSSASSSQPFDVVEASIQDVRNALESQSITCVDLAMQYLHRISKYDCRNLALNAIPILNPDLFKEASESDDRRIAGQSRGPLDGVPYTVKDSYKVKGMTVASGSPAFQTLQSNEDAFTVAMLRDSGAVLIGKTNMPPMAYGGMQRGVYGRAENPYNLEYLAAAFGSGSSNGSAVATSASFAAFGMGEETVSSGRSPASNNALVAYTPSRGYISIRGNWPLYPTCDVVVPHTRTMADMLELLDVIAAKDSVTRGDFWRDQPFIKLPEPWAERPKSFKDVAPGLSLKGLRIAVPSCYIGGDQLPGATNPVYVAPETVALWERAKAQMEADGAEFIVVSDFPAVRHYENPDFHVPGDPSDLPRLPENWNAVERGALIAHAWDEFLRQNNDPEIPRLAAVDPERIFPAVDPGHPQIKYTEPGNAVIWSRLTSHIDDFSAVGDNGSTLPGTLAAIKTLPDALQTVETLRRRLLEDWMSSNSFDLVAFPAAGDVGRADADASHPSAQHAWSNGVKYSNGNRALRHLGIPSMTVPMGVLEDKGIPMGLTICGKAYDDLKLLAYAVELEKVLHGRSAPKLTPPLDYGGRRWTEKPTLARPDLVVHKCIISERGSVDRNTIVSISGTLSVPLSAELDPDGSSCSPEIEVFIDSTPVPASQVAVQPPKASPSTGCFRFEFESSSSTAPPPAQDERNKTEALVARDQIMVVVLARYTVRKAAGVAVSRPSGYLQLLN